MTVYVDNLDLEVEKTKVQVTFLLYDQREDLRTKAAVRIRKALEQDPEILRKCSLTEGDILRVLELVKLCSFLVPPECGPGKCLYPDVPAEDYSTTSKANVPCTNCQKLRW